MTRSRVSTGTLALAALLALGSCGGGGSGSGGSSNPSPAPAPAPSPTPSATVAEIEAVLATHIGALAGDSYGGRFPGTTGEVMTHAYIQAELESYGFGPGMGGSWLQQVPLRGNQPVSVSLSINGTATVRNDGYLYRSSVGTVDLPGRQLVAINSLSDIPADMSGRIALVEGNSVYGDTYSTAEARGADAVYLFFTDEGAFADIEYILGRGRFEIDDGAVDDYPTLAIVGPSSAQAMLDALGTDINGFRAANGVIGTGNFVAVAEERTIAANQIVGLLPGTNPSAGAIVMLAHHDHLGTCGRPGSADTICNGAVDNASGIAAMLETAKRLAEGDPLERDIYVFGTTAEEMGLLGAFYFIDNPPVPLSRIHAALNVDTLAIAPEHSPLGVIGWGQTRLDQTIRDAAAAVGRTLSPGNETELYLRRQDGWAFLQSGIPSVLPSSSFVQSPALDAYFNTRYHRPNDELTASVELGGAAEDVLFYVELMRRWATPSLLPAAATSTGQRAQVRERIPADGGHDFRHKEF